VTSLITVLGLRAAKSEEESTLGEKEARGDSLQGMEGNNVNGSLLESFLFKLDIIKYLQNLQNKRLDLVIMKYTLDHIKNINKLFFLLSKKMKDKSVFIATITLIEPRLKGSSTSARYWYKGKEIPIGKDITLKDEDKFTIKFLKELGNFKSEYLEGAETVKYYHSLTPFFN